MAVTFDTLKAATQLRQEAGFSKKQATGLVAFANTILENVATKADVAELRGDVEKMETGLRGEMHKLRHQMTVRFGAGIGAAVAIIVALDKLI